MSIIPAHPVLSDEGYTTGTQARTETTATEECKFLPELHARNLDLCRHYSVDMAIVLAVHQTGKYSAFQFQGQHMSQAEATNVSIKYSYDVKN
jgi:hypothetical protein